MSKYGAFSGPYFPVFGLITEIYGVRTQSKHRKIQTKKNSVFAYLSRSDLGSSARNGKLHITCPVDVRLGSKWGSAQRLILENKMKNVENKAILKC